MADLPTYDIEDNNIADANKLFVVDFEKTGIGTTEVPALLFRNPGGSGKTIKFYHLTLSNFHTVTSFIKIRAYVSPTVTANGTVETPECTHVGAATAVALVNNSPTVSSNGTKLAHWTVAAFSNSLLVPLEFIALVDAGGTLLVTAQGDGSSRILAGNLTWAEL